MVNKLGFKILTETGQVLKKIIRDKDGNVIGKILEHTAPFKMGNTSNAEASLFKIGENIEAAKPKFNIGQPATDCVEIKLSSGVKIGMTEADNTPYGIMQRALNHESLDLELASRLFKEQTGIQLHSPTQWDLETFKESTAYLVGLKNKGLLPIDIKHLLIGHGTGSSVNGTWTFCDGGQNVFSYINKNIPRGEIVLVSTCEEANRGVVGKPGIGFPVHTYLLNQSRPGKIVSSGTNEIIGHFVNGKITYY